MTLAQHGGHFASRFHHLSSNNVAGVICRNRYTGYLAALQNQDMGLPGRLFLSLALCNTEIAAAAAGGACCLVVVPSLESSHRG